MAEPEEIKFEVVDETATAQTRFGRSESMKSAQNPGSSDVQSPFQVRTFSSRNKYLLILLIPIILAILLAFLSVAAVVLIVGSVVSLIGYGVRKALMRSSNRSITPRGM